MASKDAGKNTESVTSRVKLAEQNGHEDDRQTEVTVQISVPHEGGRGWLVLCGAFTSIFILDGVAYTFGSILHDMSADLKVSDSLVALINSTSVALYFLLSPLASGLINRYGFRACVMTGSIISSFSLFFSYFITNYGLMCLFYGVTAGLGYCLINMSSILVVGFYFEKLRSLAMSLATSGSSAGIMVLYPVNSYLVKLAGWRSTTLLHCGLLGAVFFLGMTYRPLLSLNITKNEDNKDPSDHSVKDLPSMKSTSTVKPPRKLSRTPSVIPIRSERLFSGISNSNYPTATEVITSTEEASLATVTKLGTSTAPPSKITLTASAPLGTLSRRQLKQVQSIVSRTNVQANKPNISLIIHDREEVVRPKKRRCSPCCECLCHWEPHSSEARPMYRDDAFYDGKIEKLDAYQKSLLDTTEESRTGLEYRMAVSRTVGVSDLRERRGVFTIAVKRVLATMMDPHLLKRYSFLLICLSGFMTYLGYLVPYVYLQDRNLKGGMDPKYCTFLVSAIGLFNGIGRIVIGCLASKIDPIKIFASLYTLAGLSTIFSNYSFNLYFQYSYSCLYGFCISSSCLRSVIIVSLYGLDKLTNATGMMMIFLGVGNLISTPMASVLKNSFGYELAFVVAGIFITISGLILIPMKALALRNK